MIFTTPMSHKKQGYRFENDWTEEVLQSGVDERWKSTIVIPVDVEIETEHHVLNLENVTQILSNARTISVMDCACRVKLGHCDAPINVCIDMDGVAERNISNGSARKINLEEALDILKKTHEAGLVHMAYARAGEYYKPGTINSVCSCCSCCCSVLSSVLRFGLAPHMLTSNTTSVTITSDCTDCGVCVERCQFGAREMVNGSLTYKPSLCFGCGLCISTCPTNAISLVDK